MALRGHPLRTSGGGGGVVLKIGTNPDKGRGWFLKIRTSGKYKIVMLEISTDYCINYEINEVPRKVKLINQKNVEIF